MDLLWSINGNAIAAFAADLIALILVFLIGRRHRTSHEDEVLRVLANLLIIISITLVIFLVYEFGQRLSTESKLETFESAWTNIQYNYMKKDKSYRSDLALALEKFQSATASESLKTKNETYQADAYVKAWKAHSMSAWRDLLADNPDEPLAHMAKYELDHFEASLFVATDPLWKKLQNALENAPRDPSPSVDQGIKDILDAIQVKGLTATNPDQTQALQQASAAADRLARSDERLRAVHEAAAAWRSRAPCMAPELNGSEDLSNTYDHERMIGNDYDQDAKTISDARALLGWKNKGFTGDTPVYLFAADPQGLEGTIANSLKEVLGNLHFVDWRNAAHCIEVRNAESVPIRRESESVGKGVQTMFYLDLHWINDTGSSSLHIEGSTIRQSGTDTIREGTTRQALETAISTAQARIEHLLRSPRHD